MTKRWTRLHAITVLVIGLLCPSLSAIAQASIPGDKPVLSSASGPVTLSEVMASESFVNDTQDPRGLAPNGFLPKPSPAKPYGFIEMITLGSETPLQFKAKLDTGADTSSLDAKDVKRIRRGDKRLVRFTVVNPDSGQSITIERPFVRRVRIKRHSGNHQSRNVVRLEICLGDERRSIEMSLIDRGLFEYPVLLGRSALHGIALVDPGQTFTAEPTCHFPTIKSIPEEIPLPLEPALDRDSDVVSTAEPGQAGL